MAADAQAPNAVDPTNAPHQTYPGEQTSKGSAPAKAPESGSWLANVPATSWTAGLVLVAGMLHLVLVDDHFGHALAAGLFFLGLGFVQVLWALAYHTKPSAKLERFGLVVLMIAPTILYVLTRMVRAPWANAPEAVDIYGVFAVLAQLGAAAVVLRKAIPKFNGQQIRALAGAGILLATAGYGAAIASENVSWLSASVGGHGDGDAHGLSGHHSSGPGGSEDDGHGGHGTLALLGTRGVNVVNTTTYYGPTTGAELVAACNSSVNPGRECWLHHMKDLLEAEGAVASFDLLVDLSRVNAAANNEGHDLAHVLGHHAFLVYGLDISLTLGECSYEVFQGCIHGALQAYFDDLARQGTELTKASLNTLCSAATSQFEVYTCYHGVGHGITMYTNYDLPGSLDTCDMLTGWFERASCVGGVFMENVVAYHDSLDPDHEAHDHGHGEEPTYWINPDDPAFPCNAVKAKFASACWRMQTSVILRANGADFQAAALICDAQGDYADACYSSLGRDAAPYGDRQASRMSKYCSYASTDAFRTTCIEAFTAGVILQENDPESGMALCTQLSVYDKEACYRETGVQARFMRTVDEVNAMCDAAPEQYQATCKAE